MDTIDNLTRYLKPRPSALCSRESVILELGATLTALALVLCTAAIYYEKRVYELWIKPISVTMCWLRRVSCAYCMIMGWGRCQFAYVCDIGVEWNVGLSGGRT